MTKSITIQESILKPKNIYYERATLCLCDKKFQLKLRYTLIDVAKTLLKDNQKSIILQTKLSSTNNNDVYIKAEIINDDSLDPVLQGAIAMSMYMNKNDVNNTTKNIGSAIVRFVSSSNLILPERIVSAAIRFDVQDNHQGDRRELIITSVRHHDPISRNIQQQIERFNFKMSELEQGFITNKGNFVSRKNAMKIANAQEQILRYSTNISATTLFSEDLY